MKINKKQLFFSFIFLIFILILFSIHNLGFDEPLATVVDDTTKEPGTYLTLFTLFIQLLIWIFIATVLLLIWGSMLEALTPRMTKTVINTLRVLGRMIIVPFCIIAYLNNFPAFQGTLLGISAILGTAIGFASTTTMGNFLAGLYIMAARPFMIGDYIILPDSKVEGRVKEITVNYTKITLPTGNTILVSNGKFLGQSIINTRTTKMINNIVNIFTFLISSDQIFTVSEISRFDDRINLFWNQIKDNYIFITEKTRDYLNWRYCDKRGGNYIVKIVEKDILSVHIFRNNQE